MKRIALLVVFFFTLGSYQLFSQAYLELIMNPNENTTLQEIQTLAEDYFSTHSTGKSSGYKQYKRWEYKMERMVNVDGKIQNASRRNWDVIKKLNSSNPGIEKSMMGTWSNLGPTSFTVGNSGYSGGLGRVNVIAFDPFNNQTIYLGTPSGGVWKSPDLGATWSPMSDFLASIGVSGIAVDHTTANTVYILTGDGDGGDTFSIGIMKSTDGGATWAPTGLTWGITQFNKGYKLLMDPGNSSIMYAVTSIGILKTTDGWATWSNVLPGDFRDMEFKPDNSSILYACTINSFHRSTDAGATWSTIGTGLPTGENRSALAVSPGAPNYVYYLAGPGGFGGAGTYNGLYRSTDAGLTFSSRSTTPNVLGNDFAGGGTSDQSWYDLSISVSPFNGEIVNVGGVNIWKSNDGGTNFNIEAHWIIGQIANGYVHADIHDLVYQPGTERLFCGSDGGISISEDDGATWTNIWDGLEIMQFYKIDGVEANQNLLLGGAQDNGSHKYTGSPTIEHSLGGDGMDNMIDYSNNNILYMSFQNGGLQRSTNGASTFTGIQPAGSTGSWVTPYAMDATTSSIIYGGYNDVYRSTNMGTTWTNLGSDGRGAFALGVNDPARLYAAVGGSIETSSNTGGSWTNISAGLPGLTITAIAVDPANASKVWVTLGGYTAGQKVYHSTNAGATWTNISGALPNAPALSIAHQSAGAPADAIYVGMAVGVYYSSSVTPWTVHEADLPNVPIFDLEINHTNNKIRAGTYGRGIWEAALFVQLAPPNDLCDNAIPIACGSTTAGTTTLATADAAPFCGTSNTAPGVWYTFVGNGGLATLTTCSPNSNYDTKLTVYTGTCAGLVCVAGNDDDFSCPNSIFHSTVQFCSVAGTTYRVLVHGFGSGTGDFELSLTCGLPLAVVCPPASLGTISCNDPIPPAATTVAGFIALGGNITGGCPPVAVTSMDDLQPPGDICGGQTLTRTYTISDANNSFTCVQTLTITPPDPPTVVCPPDMTVQCEADIIVVATDAIVTTDCGQGFTQWVTQPDIVGARDCDGTTYTYTYKAADDCGQIGTCTQTWTLQNAAPTISVPLGTTVECAADIVTDPSDATVTVSCGDPDDLDVIIYAPVVSGTADCPNTTYTYTYRVEDQCEREATADRVFTIQNAAPTIDAPANTTCECLAGITPNGANATVDVSCDLGYDVTAGITGSSGIQDCPGTVYTVTYTATDDCNRSASDNQTFTIQNGPPVFVNAPSVPLQLNCEDQGWEYIIQAWLANVQATNSCGTPLDVTNNYIASTQGVCISNGTKVVTWTARDQCNRTSTFQSMIIINDTEPPVFTTPAQDELDICNYNTQAEFAAWLAAHGNAVAVDGCDQNITSNQWSTIPNNPQFPNCANNMGSTSMTVTFVVRDDCGNKTSSTATFTALMTGGDFVEPGDGEVEAVNGFELMQNKPNPFMDETLIGFVLPEDMPATLTIFDISGKRLKVFQGDYNKGYNEVQISRSELSTYGILFYQLETENQRLSKKMIIIE